jgi:hypothetical protein
VSSDKFVRAMILPLRGKDRLSGKRLKETRLVVGEFPYKLLNGDVAPQRLKAVGGVLFGRLAYSPPSRWHEGSFK